MFGVAVGRKFLLEPIQRVAPDEPVALQDGMQGLEEVIRNRSMDGAQIQKRDLEVRLFPGQRSRGIFLRLPDRTHLPRVLGSAPNWSWHAATPRIFLGFQKSHQLTSGSSAPSYVSYSRNVPYARSPRNMSPRSGHGLEDKIGEAKSFAARRHRRRAPSISRHGSPSESAGVFAS